MSTFDLDRIGASGLIGSIDYHDSIGSTNDRALELGAREELKLPTLVLAEQQTAGRGRGVNRWMSSAGALTFSLILEAPPDRLPARRWPQVALAAGVAVCDALRSLAGGPDVRVKWPNDVYLAGRKICGILSESVSGLKDRLVVGVGLNVNNRVQGTEARGQKSEVGGEGVTTTTGSNVFSTEYSVLSTVSLKATATSLIDHDSVRRDLTNVLLVVLDEFDRRWRELVGDRFDEIAANYRRSCVLTGKYVRIEQAGGRMVMGNCTGIDGEGMLVVVTENGEERVASGTVSSWTS